jgi:hypothetical protein
VAVIFENIDEPSDAIAAGNFFNGWIFIDRRKKTLKIALYIIRLDGMR